MPERFGERVEGRPWHFYDNVTGPPGALLFDVKPEIAQEKSL